MRNWILGLLLFACSIGSFAQNINLDWAMSNGGTSTEIGYDIVTDDFGNVYITGVFQGAVDFDPGNLTYILNSNGGYDAFVQKLDANGNFLWAISMGGTLEDGGGGIALDSSGNVIVTGYFRNTVDFDPGSGTVNMSAQGGLDVFIQKLDPNGNLIWVRSIGGASNERGYAIATDNEENVLVTGYFRGTADLAPGNSISNYVANGVSDIFVLKLDSVGNWAWSKAFGGSVNDQGHSITTDKMGNIYVTGDFHGTVDFDPGPLSYPLASNGGYDCFIQKLDHQGDFIWARSFGGTGEDLGNWLKVDVFQNVFTTGSFHNLVDFAPDTSVYALSSNGGYDAFIQKLDQNGNFVWAQSYGGIGDDYGRSIALASNGDVYSTGSFVDSVDFAPGAPIYNLISNGSSDIFVQKSDSNGNLKWARGFGGNQVDLGWAIEVSKVGKILTTGEYQGIVNFSPDTMLFNLSAIGSADIFIQQLSECFADTTSDVITACKSYIWINGVTYTASNNSAMDTLVNIGGCDSLVILDLTITNLDTSVLVLGGTLSSNAAVPNYQWLDCNNNYARIVGASGQVFMPIVSGNYAVEVDDGVCTDTSACVNISLLNLDEVGTELNSKIFPIPNTGRFNVALSGIGESTITVYNELGQMVYKRDKIDKAVHQVRIANDHGLFYVEVSTENNREVHKVYIW